MYLRFDPKIEMSAYNDNSPLETAIENDQMEIWRIMQKSVELSEQEKLEQLQAMIEKMDSNNPQNEFEELLSTLPVKLVRKRKAMKESHTLKIKNVFKVSSESIGAKGRDKHTLLQVWSVLFCDNRIFLAVPSLFIAWPLDHFMKSIFWNLQNCQAVSCYILIDKEMLEKAFCSNFAPSLSSGNHLFHKVKYRGRNCLK